MVFKPQQPAFAPRRELLCAARQTGGNSKWKLGIVCKKTERKLGRDLHLEDGAEVLYDTTTQSISK
jgi:hypothetical protein